MLMKVYSCIKILKIALSYGMSHKTPSQKKHHKKGHRKNLYRYSKLSKIIAFITIAFFTMAFSEYNLGF